MHEELGIYAKIGDYFCTSTFMHKNTEYDMCVFKVHDYQGHITLHEHLEIAWVRVDQLFDYAYPEPDLPIVALLQKQHQN